jgi:hypothetical protein
MADIVLQRDVQSLLTARLASAFVSATAGGAGNATAVTGLIIDRMATGSLPLNAELMFAYSATLAANKTLSIGALSLSDSADGSTFATLSTYTDPGVFATGPTGGATLTGVLKLGVALGAARRFIRFGFTPTLSNTSTDTASLVAVLNLAGFDRLPAS